MEIEWRIDGAVRDQVAARPDVLVARLAARQWGVLDVRELCVCGLTADAIARRVRTGRLHPMYRGVYAVGHANPAREGWWLAAIKASRRDAVLARHSCAMHLGVMEWEQRWPDVLVLGESRPAQPRINAYRTAGLPPEHVTTHRGIPVTTAERTLLDLAGVMPEHRLRRAVRQAQFLKLTTVGSLAAVLAGPGPVNEPLYLDGRRIVPDLRWPAQRLVIEADGQHHDDPLAGAGDLQRQAILEAHGDRVERVTWEQASGRPRETLDRFAAAGAPRRAT
jgi:hypothetical protein